MRTPSNKVTVKKLFSSYFKPRHPTMAKRVLHYEAGGFFALKIWLNNGDIILYHGDTDDIETIRKGWGR